MKRIIANLKDNDINDIDLPLIIKKKLTKNTTPIKGSDIDLIYFIKKVLNDITDNAFLASKSANDRIKFLNRFRRVLFFTEKRMQNNQNNILDHYNTLNTVKYCSIIIKDEFIPITFYNHHGDECLKLSLSFKVLKRIVNKAKMNEIFDEGELYEIEKNNTNPV
jgi:hypothetical protein